jgi:GDP dissociation inhibitor
MLLDWGTGLALLGPTDEKFTDVTDIYAPISDGAEDKAFVSKSAPLAQHCLAAERAIICPAVLLRYLDSFIK